MVLIWKYIVFIILGELNQIFDYFNWMIEKSYYKNTSAHRSLSEESIKFLEWDNLKTQLSSFASTKMGENAIFRMLNGNGDITDNQR